MKKLYRNSIDGMIGGVCAGLGEYFSIDPAIPRLVFAFAAVAGFGAPVLVYVVMWIVIEEE